MKCSVYVGFLYLVEFVMEYYKGLKKCFFFLRCFNLECRSTGKFCDNII